MLVKMFGAKVKLFCILCLCVFLVTLFGAPIKVKVIVDGASVKGTPDIGGQTLARVTLYTILDAEEKEGSWYKVYMENEGVQVSGFIHEMLVEEYTGEDIPAGQVASGTGSTFQAELIAEIELKVETNKNLIRQEQELKEVIERLRPLIAKTFNISDVQRQKQIASEIYLWMGLAYSGQNDLYAALKEFRNMFEVEPAYAKEMTRNIIDPEVVALVQNAENEYKGLITEYSLEVSTNPKEATVKIDGKEIGLSPEVYRTPVPKFVLDIEKEGFKPINEEIFLTLPNSKKEYVLESAGKSIFVKTNPPGAQVFLNEQDTGMLTDCEIPLVPYGNHKLFLIKNNYASWENFIDVSVGPEPLKIEVVLTANRYGFRGKWGDPTNALFSQPMGIALDNENNFYVANISDISIKKFDATGRIVPGWGDSGREFRKVKAPAGIAVDSRGAVYVTDLKTDSVFIFSKAGVYVNKWDKSSSGDKAFSAPLGIAVDRAGDVYVADSGNHRVMKFSTAGALKKTWGKQGTGNGEFVNPSSIAFNQNNEVYVVDRSRVQKFTSEGQFLGSFGTEGTGDGQFSRPMSLFLDTMNYVYVADSANNRIQKFDPEGVFVTKWGSKGSADGQLSYPVGIAIDRQDRIFVVERDNNRVQEFGIGGR
ncbi:MAG: PEGA domain-containing protein [Candidatus Aminicenantes bacterium]|nr:PEGA domain-containing protein [Candidatus Aminicenantes bacterium]